MRIAVASSADTPKAVQVCDDVTYVYDDVT